MHAVVVVGCLTVFSVSTIALKIDMIKIIYSKVLLFTLTAT